MNYRVTEPGLLLGMTNRYFILLLPLVVFSQIISAQNTVSGKVYSSANDSVLHAVTVYNKHLRVSAYSGRDGHYIIVADEGDSLLFSAVGFTPDTVVVQFSMLLTPYDVTLQQKMMTLEGVKIKSSYYDDSVKRRLLYGDAFNKGPGITGRNSPTDGVGVVFSPLSYFSSKAKAQRALRKRLLKEERDDYIDRAFPKEWVERLTGLKGDSLTLFMYRYRPSYEYCRKTDRDAMLLYINEKLKEFRKPD